MPVACGFVRVPASDGRAWTFLPSFARIASIGTPQEIVKAYADLHGPKAGAVASYILTCLCEQEDALPLVGWMDEEGAHDGLMPHEGEWGQIHIARYLMTHGIIGTAKPSEKGSGQFSDKFDAADYITASRIHFGLSIAEAEALTMTEFQRLREMKFPPKVDGKRDVPTREEYEASLKAIEGRRNG